MDESICQMNTCKYECTYLQFLPSAAFADNPVWQWSFDVAICLKQVPSSVSSTCCWTSESRPNVPLQFQANWIRPSTALTDTAIYHRPYVLWLKLKILSIVSDNILLRGISSLFGLLVLRIYVMQQKSHEEVSI